MLSFRERQRHCSAILGSLSPALSARKTSSAPPWECWLSALGPFSHICSLKKFEEKKLVKNRFMALALENMASRHVGFKAALCFIYLLIHKEIVRTPEGSAIV